MFDRVPKLLISVRSTAEAIIALDGGADIIDIKEPSRGALGMADPAVIAAIVEAIGGRVPVSAALGELRDAPPAMPASALGGLTYAKIGVSFEDHDVHQLRARFAAAPNAKPIIAHFAETLAADSPIAPMIERSLDWLQAHGGAGLLLDTRNKTSADLFACLSATQLEAIIEATHQRDMLIALAGRLAGDSLRRAADLGPDIIGVRGAACRQGDRGQTLDAQRVQQVRALISESRAPQHQPARAGAAG